jgi:hypothetical protein
MDEQRSPVPPQQNPGAFGRLDLGLLLALLLIAIGLRSWQLAHTEVAARDSIGYIRIAWQLEEEIERQRAHRANPDKPEGDWPKVIRSAAQHPAYPAALLVVSLPVRRWYGGELPLAMQWSAQLTSVFASVLLVIPMFLLGRGLFDRRAGFVAAVLFQCLPTSGRLMADGLSEPVFLLFTCTALLCAHHGLRKGSPGWFAGVGLFGALAYLTRPEGAFIVAATGLVLFGLQAFAAWRRPWLSFVQCGVLLTWGALTVAGPFVLIVGGLTTKNTPLQVMKDETAQAAVKFAGAEEQDEAGAVADAGGVFAPPPATGTPNALETGQALWLVARTFNKSFYYVTWLPALVGLAVFINRFRAAPVSWVMLLLSLTLGYFLYRVPVVMGYLSDRHTVLILFCATFWLAAGILQIGDWGTRLAAYLSTGRLGRQPVWAAALLLPLIAGALVKTLEPLHTDRIPYREAGFWLARYAQPTDDIDDPYCWASFYAGRVFLESQGPLPAHEPATCYVVFEQSEKGQRLHPHTDPQVIAADGKLVKSWPVKRGKEMSLVVIYEIKPRVHAKSPLTTDPDTSVRR